MNKHECKICKLHYSDKEYADKCYKWCKDHKSCNIEVTKHSLEVLEKIKGIKNNEKN